MIVVAVGWLLVGGGSGQRSPAPRQLRLTCFCGLLAKAGMGRGCCCVFGGGVDGGTTYVVPSRPVCGLLGLSPAPRLSLGETVSVLAEGDPSSLRCRRLSALWVGERHDHGASRSRFGRVVLGPKLLLLLIRLPVVRPPPAQFSSSTPIARKPGRRIRTHVRTDGRSTRRPIARRGSVLHSARAGLRATSALV